MCQLLERCAPRAAHIHEDIGYPEPERGRRRELGWQYGERICFLDTGGISLVRVHDLLRDAGHDPDLCIADEALGRFPDGQRQEALRRSAEHQKRIVADEALEELWRMRL